MSETTITLSVVMDAVQYVKWNWGIHALKMLVVSQSVEPFEVMDGKQQKIVMMETVMTTMDVHLHAQ